MNKNKEENIYITNKKKGKKIILIGWAFIIIGLLYLFFIPKIAVPVLIIGFIIASIGKIKHWYSN